MQSPSEVLHGTQGIGKSSGQRDQIMAENPKPFTLSTEMYMKADQSPEPFCVLSFTAIIRLWQWE